MDLFQLGWDVRQRDPDNLPAVALPTGPPTPSAPSEQNAEYHSCWSRRQTFDQAKRAEIYKKAQQLMYDEMP